MFFSTINPLYSLSGLAVGMIVGLTGVGGGSLMTPLLVLLFGVHPATAVGTDLLYAAATKTAGTFVHGRSKTVNWRIVGLLASGSAPATLLTLLCLNIFGLQGARVSASISFTLGIALVLTSLSLVFRRQIVAFARRNAGQENPRRTALLTMITGAVLGILVSISSVGAGALGVTALIILYPKLPTVRIVGSDIAHAVPLTLLAGIGHWWLGSVDWAMLLSLLIGSIPGIMIASMLAPKLPEHVLRLTLAVVLALVGLRLVLG
ncbi:MAG: sulfite exporter TauE/SafE family protein [Proteobacteria bacterium]|nr:sulfite exporter TauE/SafE family protein [Pseudomonadota bacterium]MBS0572862.1 sulfite exporter TauE/SafE family protein [Pseudomonadota bacterium]